jgi:hypothetical protein
MPNDNGGIPLLGLPCDVHGGEVSAIATCKCDPQNTPFLISGVSMGFVCGRCLGVYRIVGALFDASRGDTAARVAVARVAWAERNPETPREPEPSKPKLKLM